jgi:Na+/H+ antiporter NhaD/arsenite permease-like protein
MIRHPAASQKALSETMIPTLLALVAIPAVALLFFWLGRERAVRSEGDDPSEMESELRRRAISTGVLVIGISVAFSLAGREWMLLPTTLLVSGAPAAIGFAVGRRHRLSLFQALEVAMGGADPAEEHGRVDAGDGESPPVAP